MANGEELHDVHFMHAAKFMQHARPSIMGDINQQARPVVSCTT